MQNIKEKIIHGTKSFPIAYYKIDKNHIRYTMQVHWHHEFEILRVTNGSLELHLDNNCYNAKMGDVFLLPGGTVHSATPKDCTYECLVFNLEKLLPQEDLCKDELYNLIMGNIALKNPLNLSNNTKNILDSVFNNMSKKETFYGLAVKGGILLFFNEILSNKRLYEKSSKKTVLIARQEAFKKVITYIESHFYEAISLNTLSNLANMSPNYFCRFFKSVTGYTPIEYLIYYKIERASDMLCTTSLSVTDIALNCGFKDISHFINTFKKLKGSTPLKYRQNKKTEE